MFFKKLEMAQVPNLRDSENRFQEMKEKKREEDDETDLQNTISHNIEFFFNQCRIPFKTLKKPQFPIQKNQENPFQEIARGGGRWGRGRVIKLK